jgi:hypothetical protein
LKGIILLISATAALAIAYRQGPFFYTVIIVFFMVAIGISLANGATARKQSVIKPEI